MKHIKKVLLTVTIFCCAFQLPSESRESDGTLGLIQTPNNGVPVITTSAISFQATLSKEATLTLIKNDGSSSPLHTTWTPLPGDLVQAQCTMPVPPLPGTYTLCAETNGIKDCNIRSVYIRESIPESYTIAHITDTHIGTTRHPRESIAIISDIIDATNTSEADLVLITGDLTEDGTPEQFQHFLEVMDRCQMPTFVIAGNHDRKLQHYEHFFGPLTYMFRFGKDGYLGYDTKNYIIADELDEQDGLLYYYRRQLRSARWSIGFTHRYALDMGVRAQLTLFVDDPLDYLVYGHYHREAEEQDGIPWGNTTLIMTPAAINGQFRLITVNNQGLAAQETIQAAVTTLQEPDLPLSDSK